MPESWPGGLRQSGISVSTHGGVTLEAAAGRRASTRKFDHGKEIAESAQAQNAKRPPTLISGKAGPNEHHRKEESAMNEDTVKGNWKQVSGQIKQKWGKLTDDDLMKAEGDKDYLLGKLQEHYGLAKDKAEQFLKDLGH